MQIQNIFADLPRSLPDEQFLALFQNEHVKIERIISHAHASPTGFWYDQEEEEWVIVLRGHAVLEFEDGELVQLKDGDYLTIPSHLKHRVKETGPETIWLAVHVATGTTRDKS
jgi:cupin 2 domain-containing protein